MKLLHDNPKFEIESPFTVGARVWVTLPIGERWTLAPGKVFNYALTACMAEDGEVSVLIVYRVETEYGIRTFVNHPVPSGIQRRIGGAALNTVFETRRQAEGMVSEANFQIYQTANRQTL